MEKKQVFKIATWTIILFLFSWLILNTAGTLGFMSEPNPLWETHQELMLVEQRMSEVKPLCNELDLLRLKRDELVGKTNSIINKEDFKESETTQTRPVVIPTNPSPNFEPVVKAWKEPIKEVSLATFDINKLAYAVAMAETGDCTTGMGVTKNNCFGIMEWPNGIRQGKTYASKEESYADFKDIWLNKYGGGFPTYGMAKIWTGNDHPDNWLSIVNSYY